MGSKATDRDIAATDSGFKQLEGRLDKFKLTHQRADSGEWSSTPQARRRHLINILQQVVDDLEQEALSNKPVGGAESSDGTPSRNGHNGQRKPAPSQNGRAARKPGDKRSQAA